MSGDIFAKIESKVLYVKPGAEGTAELIEAVVESVKGRDLGSGVVASTKGSWLSY